MQRLCLAIGLSILSTVVACNGVDGNGSCRDTNDCRGEEECSGRNDSPACGMGPQRGCATDQDCFGDDNFCHAVGDFCSYSGIGSNCGAACTSEGCGQGFRCNAAGACEVLACDEGFACPEYQVCDMTSVVDVTTVYDRHNGCVNVDCTDDAQCLPDHACVNGFCQTGLGNCEIPQIVP